MFEKAHIRFMKVSKIALVFSVALLLISVISLFTRGLNLGVDFTGGSVIQVSYPGNANISEIRDTLTNAGYDAAVQPFGTAQDVLIRLPEQSTGSIAERNTISDNVVKTLSDVTPGVTLQRVEFVGPQIGDELRDQGGIAMLLALAGILIYVALRFEFRFSVSAIAALVHDVTITVGFFSITGMEFDLTTLAAILAIIGYSLNDTIVVFDRIRENFLKLRKAETADSIDLSINETLSRTLMTSFTTVIVVVSLFVFGGEIIHSFSVAMLVGITIGTYSSIYVASTSLIAMGVTRDSLLPPAKDETDEDLDAIP